MTAGDNANNTAVLPAAELHISGSGADSGVTFIAAPSSAKPATSAPAAAGAVAAALVVIALWLLLW